MSESGALAIILARAGSKGLPGKNSAMLAGKPCVQWTIEAAMNSACVDRIVMSSDDADVNDCAHKLGCTIVDRPADLAHDTATIDDAARHAYQAVGSPDVPIVILYANVPIRPESLIDDAVRLLVESGCDSVQSFAAVGKHHPWWTVKVDESGMVHPWEGEVLYHGCFRRQDLPSAQIPDGGVIALTGDALMRRVGAVEGPHCFLGNDRRGIITNEGDVVDIDSRVDQIVADAILRERGRKDFTTEHAEHTEKEGREERGGKKGGRKEGEKKWDGRDAELTHRVIGCAIQVHRELGPGLLESVYETCLFDELCRSGFAVEQQVVCDVAYKGRTIQSGLRMDIVVENRVVIELKAVDGLKRVHFAQLMSYLKLSDKKLGLLINFNEHILKAGIKRIILE
jgi:GxxExxY protein